MALVWLALAPGFGQAAEPPGGAAPEGEARALLAQLNLEPASHGELIYVGRVFPLRGGWQAPRFVYQRRVQGTDAAATSTCLTFEGQEVVLVDVAEHDLAYRLRTFTEYQFQTGEVGTVRVSGDVVRFHLAGPRARADREERVGLPVVVGPTVYGFVARNRDRLLAGEVVRFRYAVLSRMETIGFELSRVEAPVGQVKITMRPSSVFVALVVRPIVITYDAEGRLLSYEGPTPMKASGHPGAADFEGHVEYALSAATFR